MVGDDATPKERIEKVAYERGFKAGFSEGQSRAAVDIRQLKAEIERCYKLYPSLAVK